ncbi:MAG: hypothetical protein ACI8ZN_000943 [Bacteroidia bacterium]
MRSALFKWTGKNAFCSNTLTSSIEVTSGFRFGMVSPEKRTVLYPNPTENYLNIRLSEQSLPAQIVTWDSKGSLVKSSEIGELNIALDLTNLRPGLYLYRISGGVNYVGRFIKE